MTPGNAATLAGHAFLDSFHEASCTARRAYLGQGPAAIKVTLRANDDAHLVNIAAQCRKAGIACAW
jgi:hypothetical protein